jgi:ribosomal-protein-alanine N-acetyltransferase
MSATGNSTASLRLARVGDVEQLARIERDAFSDPWPESAFREFLDRAHARCSVAVDANDRAIGYCVMLVMADEAEIANIAVARENRRTGVAALLLDDAIATARERHVSALYLEVRTSNAAARALYESRNFRMVGRRRGYYQHPTEDALILRWSSGA